MRTRGGWQRCETTPTPSTQKCANAYVHDPKVIRTPEFLGGALFLYDQIRNRQQRIYAYLEWSHLQNVIILFMSVAVTTARTLQLILNGLLSLNTTRRVWERQAPFVFFVVFFFAD